jgi:hypothetical protein
MTWSLMMIAVLVCFFPWNNAIFVTTFRSRMYVFLYYVYWIGLSRWFFSKKQVAFGSELPTLLASY